MNRSNQRQLKPIRLQMLYQQKQLRILLAESKHNQSLQEQEQSDQFEEHSHESMSTPPPDHLDEGSEKEQTKSNQGKTKTPIHTELIFPAFP